MMHVRQTGSPKVFRLPFCSIFVKNESFSAIKSYAAIEVIYPNERIILNFNNIMTSYF